MKSVVPETSINNEERSPERAGSNAAALRRRWWYLLPAVFITYSLAYVDRANYGLGAAAGLAITLHISAEQNSMLSGLFFLGYFAFQLPGTMLAERRSAVQVIFASLILWGGLAALTGVVHAFWALAAVRFFLGVAESCIFPAMLLLLTRWFTKTERSRANALLILGNPITVLWMSAITGFLIQRFGWQRTFIYEGIPAMLWAGAWLALVRDRPADADWMTAESTKLLNDMLAEEELAVVPVRATRAALLRPDVVLLSFVYFCWSVGVYGFVLWLPTIVRQRAGLSMGTTGLLSAIPYLAAILMMLAVARQSDKTLKRESLVSPFLLVAALAFMLLYFFGYSSFAIALAGLIAAGACMYAPYGPFFAIVPERVPSTVAGAVFALINSCGALGAFFGSYLVGWLQAATGNPRTGYLLMAGALVCAAGSMSVLGRRKSNHLVVLS